MQLPVSIIYYYMDILLTNSDADTLEKMFKETKNSAILLLLRKYNKEI